MILLKIKEFPFAENTYSKTQMHAEAIREKYLY